MLKLNSLSIISKLCDPIDNIINEIDNLYLLFTNIFENNNIDLKIKEMTVFGNDWETRDGSCIRDYIHVSDIADAHVPLHTSSNHNGQFTGQRGIHGFWESRVPELLSEKQWNFFIGKAAYLKNPGDFIWKRILESALASDSVLKFEKELTHNFPSDQKYAFEQRNGQQSSDYTAASYAKDPQNEKSNGKKNGKQNGSGGQSGKGNSNDKSSGEPENGGSESGSAGESTGAQPKEKGAGGKNGKPKSSQNSTGEPNPEDADSSDTPPESSANDNAQSGGTPSKNGGRGGKPGGEVKPADAASDAADEAANNNSNEPKHDGEVIEKALEHLRQQQAKNKNGGSGKPSTSQPVDPQTGDSPSSNADSPSQQNEWTGRYYLLEVRMHVCATR